MAYTQKELNHLALCLGRCYSCSEVLKCALKTKVEQDKEIDGTVYDALANYYHKLYGIA